MIRFAAFPTRDSSDPDLDSSHPDLGARYPDLGARPRALFLVREGPSPEDGHGGGASSGEPASSTSPTPPSPAPPPSSPSSPTPVPVPDPFDDADALDELAEEIATLAAHIHAANHRLLVLIAEFDRRRGWELGGYRSCAHWVAARTGIDLGASRERVRAARALTELPETSAAMARGELSFSAVRALTRVATPETEADLLELARGSTTAELEKIVRAWKRGSRADEAELERERHRSRKLSVFPDDEGMYLVRGRLPAEVGALLMRALEAAGDALYREARGMGAEAAGSPEPDESRRAAARRRADAVGLLAERALAAGLGSGTPSTSESSEAPISGTRAERYQVLLHVEAATLAAEGEPGRSELEDGTRVSAETSRRLACDAALVPVTHQDGALLDVGRRRRTVPPALRRALEVRDQGCRFPDHSPLASGACGLRFCDAHHVRHWADGGETSLDNCLLLCRHHHRLIHEGGWSIEWWGEGRPAFFDPRGGTHFEGRWEPPELAAEPVARLMEENRRVWDGSGPEDEPGGDPPRADGGEGTASAAPERQPDGAPPRADGGEPHPDGWTAGARWERLEDIPDGVLFRAIEALSGG